MLYSGYTDSSYDRRGVINREIQQPLAHDEVGDQAGKRGPGFFTHIF